MRTLKLFAAAAWMLLLLTPQLGLSQANRSLSNLTSPTQVNQNLLPGTSCSKDLGSNNKKWRNLYLCGKEGININPQYPLDVRNIGYDKAINAFSPNTGETTDRIGVYSESIITDNYGYGVIAQGGYYGVSAFGFLGAADNTTHGVSGEAVGTACNGGTVIGVEGNAHGATNNIGIFGNASDDAGCGGFTAAGYFNGDVYATNVITPSDRKFKASITLLKSSTSLEQLMKLKPSSYEFKTAEYSKMGFSRGKQMGLIADEVKQVFPELVKEAVNPARYDKDRKLISKEEKYESVNYIQLIPVLIASFQEQQKTIDAVKAENQELKSRLDAIEQSLAINSKQISAPVTLSDARLEQNAPNPFSQNTIINYYLPDKSGTAVMNITDMNGKIIKSVALTPKGNGQLTLEAGQLSAGSYQYSLIVNGKLLDTKKMVLTK